MKQELNNQGNSLISSPQKTVSVHQLIDSLNTTQFFIKDRANPDAPMPGREADIRARQRRTGGTTLPVEYPDETYMMLGNQLTNPYSIPVMTAAYNAYFFLNLSSVQTTHLYVRFTPQNEAQVALLEDSLDLDLYTHPLDFELLADGDLYVAPGKTIEDLPELYTVVAPNFLFPAGITYTVLAPLHIPEGDHGLLLEELAESMAAGATYTSTPLAPTEVLLVRTDLRLSTGIEPQYLNEDAQCYITNDQGIYIGDCPDFDDNPPPPPPPPSSCGLPMLQCTEDGRPRGRIRVWDTQLQVCEPVRDVKIRTKNWFKIRNTRTNDMGEFVADRKYKNRVKVNLLFRNDEVSVRPLRNNVGIRLSLFPITYTLGVYQNGCAANTIDKIFYRPENRTTREFEAWMACNAVNSRKEQIAFAENPSQGLKAMKASDHRINLYLVKQGMAFYEGPQAELLMQHYLYRNRILLDYIIDGVKIATYFASKDFVGVISTVFNLVLGSQRPDIIYSYNTHPNDPNRALENLSSNEVKQKFYEVYTQLGVLKATNDKETKWKNYFKVGSKYIDAGAGALGASVKSALKELKIINKSSSAGTAASFVITLASNLYYSINAPDREFFQQVRGFSNYYGHFMCAERYGATADALYNHKSELIFNVGGQSAHEILLDGWQPNVPVDEFANQRLGFFRDLFDNTFDQVTPINLPHLWQVDNVSGVSNKAMFYSIAGSQPGLQWINPQTWPHFTDNVEIQYGVQQPQIRLLSKAYLIPQ